MNYLPSRKILSLLVLAVGVVLGIMFAFNRKATESATLGLANITAGEKIQIPDNPNWQTDFGQIANETEVNPTELAETEDSVTDNFSVSLMSTYLDLKQSGNLNDQTAQSLIDNSLQYFNAIDLKSYQIDIPEIKVVSETGKENLEAYGERLGLILKAHRQPDKKNELRILQDAVSERNPEKIKELEEAVMVYRNILTDITKMEVPTTFVKAHRDTSLGIAMIIKGLEEMLLVFNDPYRGLKGAEIYQEGGLLFVKAVRATSEYINRSGVIYKQGTGGYYLFYGI